MEDYLLHPPSHLLPLGIDSSGAVPKGQTGTIAEISTLGVIASTSLRTGIALRAPRNDKTLLEQKTKNGQEILLGQPPDTSFSARSAPPALGRGRKCE
jgi:hypothetical protein